ncbi:MAG: DUF4355 domain-containing protein [Blautia sp.]|uniref:DUF4355 domain-containing protein n=1 Tax=Blautia sp. TaxID=1955243 RepID=UPI002E77786A|nr:DUF4355 domain-containing protein [Blautia sp.]MED9882321.1 DUF4355 domain-containing protein [Blautia sp.]
MKLKDFKMLQLFAEEERGSEQNEETGGEGVLDENGQQEEESEKKYSDEDVDKLIKRKFAEWEKKKQKEEDEAKKLAKMNAQEKADYKNRQLEDRIAELEREKTLSSMKDEARKMLSEKNINISDELLAFMVTSDAEKTKTAVDSFAELFNAAVNEAIKSKARQSVPKEGGRFNPDIRALSGIADMAREARIIK